MPLSFAATLKIEKGVNNVFFKSIWDFTAAGDFDYTRQAAWSCFMFISFFLKFIFKNLLQFIQENVPTLLFFTLKLQKRPRPEDTETLALLVLSLGC